MNTINLKMSEVDWKDLIGLPTIKNDMKEKNKSDFIEGNIYGLSDAKIDELFKIHNKACINSKDLCIGKTAILLST